MVGLTAWEKHAVGRVRIEDVLGSADPHDDTGSEALGDLLEPRTPVEGAGEGLANREPSRAAFAQQVEDCTQAIGAILFVEAALEPQALVAAADAWARRMDAATGARRGELRARHAAQLAQLIDAQHGAAQ